MTDVEALQRLFGEQVKFRKDAPMDWTFSVGGGGWRFIGDVDQRAYLCHLIDGVLLKRGGIGAIRYDAEDPDGVRTLHGYTVFDEDEGDPLFDTIWSAESGLTARIEAVKKLVKDEEK